MGKRLGIYIHIPFCASKCAYCDFYSLSGREDKMPLYQEALLSHISESQKSMQTFEIDSIYFGGGTPSYYGAKRIVEILDELKGMGNVRLDSEITVEVNPDSVSYEDMKLLYQAGVNRISMGMQSASNDLLKIIGRRHNFGQVEVAMQTIRDAGFENISLDLIYGLPSQTREDWAQTLTKALALKPRHLSCYGLKLEEGTPMFDKYCGSPLIPDEDAQADMYLYTVETLRRYGLLQYEISNFALPGFESKHNMKYWTMQDYMGFGPGAASRVGNLHYSYVRSLGKYIDAVGGNAQIIDEYEESIPIQRAAEYLMLGMRTAHGISKDEYHKIYRSNWEPLEETFEVFRKKGWALKFGSSWRLTPKGFLISNTLINAMIEAQTGVKVEFNPWLRGAFEAEEKQELPMGEEERFIDFYLRHANSGGKET